MRFAIDDSDVGFEWNSSRDVSDQHIFVHYSARSSIGIGLLAHFLARIQSTSCANRVHGDSLDLRYRRAAKVRDLGHDRFTIAYPALDHSAEVVDLLLSTYLDLNDELYSELCVESFDLPHVLTKDMAVAPFGSRILTLFGRMRRALLIAVVKPSIGLDLNDHVDAALKAFEGGSDIVKDDENLSPTSHGNNIAGRVAQLSIRLPELIARESRHMMYLFNIQSDVKALEYITMVERATPDMLHPIFGLLVSPSLGLPYVRYLRSHTRLPMFCHSAGIGLYVNGAFRLSRLAYLQLVRLAGVDAVIHAAPYSRNWECSEDLARNLLKWCRTPFGPAPSLLLCFGGGLHKDNYYPVRRLVGDDKFGYLVGGGVFGHPEGPMQGARALALAMSQYTAPDG